MGSLTNFCEGKMLDHCLNSAYTAPATVYLALCTADPTDAATGASMNEVPNSYAYARQSIAFGAASARRITQNATVTYPAASGGSWGTVTHWAIVSTNTYGAGDVLAHGAFSASKTINDGNVASVSSTEVYVEISAGEVSTYLANIWLDKVFRNQTFAKPDSYVALCTATVSDTSTGSTITEPSGGSYARKQVNPNGGSSPTWDMAVTGDPSYVDNTHAVTFAEATLSWGTIVAVAIVTASSAGEVLWYDNDMGDQAVGAGDTAEFAVGVLDVQMS